MAVVVASAAVEIAVAVAGNRLLKMRFDERGRSSDLPLFFRATLKTDEFGGLFE